MKFKVYLSLIVGLCVFPSMSFAAMFTVTNALSDASPGSFFWAIMQANATADFDIC